MWVELVTSWRNEHGRPKGSTYSPFLAMKTAQNTYVPWLISQADCLSDDWYIIASIEEGET